MKLYHAFGARSCRVRWLLEEMGIDYELAPVPFESGRVTDPAYKQENPLGKIPTLVDGDVTIFESGAIVEYLLEKHDDGSLAPKPGDPDRPAFLQWLHWSEATFLPPLGLVAQHAFLRPEEKRIDAIVPEAKADLRRCVDAIDAELGGREFLVGGRFTAADIMMGYSLQLARMLGQLPAEAKHATAYLDALAQRPAFARAFAP